MMPEGPAMNAAEYLDTLVQLGVKFGLETTRSLCAGLGHPERAFPSVLVAGTNGKGSVAAYLDHALRASGLRVGRYTSPHLVRVNERIVVDGRPVTDDELDEDLARVRALATVPTYFEALTVAAFLRFRAAAVDVAVLEVGMGGRLDATNVSDPLVSAIVSIAFDHEAYLGSTLAAIAGEKAGVVRPQRTTVLGPLPPEARQAVQNAAAACGARIVDAESGATWREGDHGLRLVTPLRTYEALRPLPGLHQRDNLLVAVRVLEEAHAAGLRVDLEQAAAGLAGTEWPGRLQWILGEVPMLLDGAHNIAGAQALARHLAGLGPFVLLFGALRDKAFPEMARLLFPLAREVVVTTPPAERAAPVDEILAAVHVPTPCHAVADLDTALGLARERARGVGPVVVAGSLYLVGAVLARLRSE
jgi:dihydrofolate synthase / folylpolyglutamate synthase